MKPLGKEHEITVHRTKVQKATVRPDPSSSSFLTETGETETVDYSSDSGGKRYTCSCGEEFQTEGEAYDHLNSNQERYVVLRTEASDADCLDFRANDFPFKARSKEHAIKKYIDEHVEDLDPEEIEQASCMEMQHYFAVKWDDIKAFGHPEEVPVHGVLGK